MVPLYPAGSVREKEVAYRRRVPQLSCFGPKRTGPLAVNTSAYVGYRLKRTLGAICSVLGAVLPSFLIILLIASIFHRFADLPMVQAAFLGMRPAIFMLMAYAAATLGRKTLQDKFSLVVAGAALLLLLLGCLPS